MRIALLCAVPPEPISDLESRQPDSFLTTTFGSFSTVERPLISGLIETSDLEIHVVTLEKNRSALAVERARGKSAIHRLPARRGSGMPAGWLPRSLQVRRYLHQTIQPDVVHGLRTDHGYATMAVLSRLPNLITIQGFLRDSPHPWWMGPGFFVGGAMEAWTIRNASNVIAISNHVTRRAQSMGSRRVLSIPNMVDDRFFNLNKATELGTVVYVGRITPEKGLLDLLRAAKLLERETSVEAEWLIVGGASGPKGRSYLRQCREAAKQLKHQSVRFLGWIPNSTLPNVYKHASCAVFPYTAAYETFGIAVVEAMAAETPPIVYNYGPLPEHISNGGTGFVQTPGDIHGLASRIQLLLSDSQEAIRMGRKARKQAVRYSKSRVLRMHEDVYKLVATSDMK